MQIFQLDHPQILQKHLARHFEVFAMVNNWDQISIRGSQRLTLHDALQRSKRYVFARQPFTTELDRLFFGEKQQKHKPFVLYGLHSCELTTIAYWDDLFAKNHHYQIRRKQALIVGLDCTSCCKQGFCLPVGAGPGVDLDYADLILHRFKHDEWLLLAVNEKAQQAIKHCALTPASVDALKRREQQLDDCEKTFTNWVDKNSPFNKAACGAHPQHTQTNHNKQHLH